MEPRSRRVYEVLPSFDAQGRHVRPMADWSARVDDPSVQTELRIALTSAIDELPPVSRTVLVLRDVEGLSNLEIAEAWQVFQHLAPLRGLALAP